MYKTAEEIETGKVYSSKPFQNQKRVNNVWQPSFT